ncbi:MAG: formate hydrogenlyase complex iron-sulfur subunit [Bacillota bacterium]|nr:MAG: formate hydrogenlyase complex iron-sulfur subunit [Bacillota bacterium]
MLKLLRKVVQTGQVTLPYPFAPVEVAPDFRGKPVYDFSRCLGCSACARACPPQAITVEWSGQQGVATWSINYGRCIFCGRCEEVCPTGAIRLSEEFELAAARAEDLVVRAELQMTRCSGCGEAFAPGRELEYVQASLQAVRGTVGPVLAERLRLCPRCRRGAAARSRRAGLPGGGGSR